MRALPAAVLVFAACSSSPAAKSDAGLDAPRDAAADASIDAPFCPAVSAVDPAAIQELVVASDAPAAGIFDPSIIYPAGAAAGVMSYSAVPDQLTIRTHVAVSSDRGATWTYVAEPNVPEVATIASTDAGECPGGTCSGNLISEVSSIIYDVTDPDTTKRWKLFAHRYLVGAGVALHYRIGTITLQTAPAPDGPWTAPQKWIGWTSPASYSSTGVQTNVNTLPGTASQCLVLTEPGAIVLPGAIDLAVGCIYLDGTTPRIRIELLRSVDHAATWTSVGTLLEAQDTACLSSGASINAADLFVSGNTEYVVATPSAASGYAGCLAFPIDDVAAGKVRRDALGRAVAIRALATSNGQFSGACTFADGAGGYAMDVLFPGTPRPFRLARTGVTTP